MASCSTTADSPVLHVVVVGFHHKKGCQVEYSYPPLIEGTAVDSHTLPDEWRHLPSLALPDGAHNYRKDTTYFHLPSRDGSHRTVYGISCYRQMDAKDLVNRTADVTRSTVQKSVCVLTKLPLYGLVQAKLELITHAYFDERDFSKVELLEQTYKHLCATLTESLLDGSRVFIGMSPREAVYLFKHKLVLLFKLILLERRVLFSGAPVQKLCTILMSVISLFPGMLEFGLEESASYSIHNQLSPTLKLANFGIDMEDYLEIGYKDIPNHKHSKPVRLKPDQQSEDVDEREQNKTEEPQKGDNSVIDEQGNIDGVIRDESDISCDNVDNVNRQSDESDPLGIVQSDGSMADLNLKIPNKSNGSNGQGNTWDRDDNRLNQGDQPQHEQQQQCERNCTDNETESKEHNLDNRNNTGVFASNISVDDEDIRLLRRSVSQEKEVIKYNSGADPLANFGSMIQVEAVQTGEVFECDPSFSDESPNLTPKRELKLDNLFSTPPPSQSTKPDHDPRKHKLESLSLTTTEDTILTTTTTTRRTTGEDIVEPIDSPESISKIDKEDCFSWEEDKLLLEIDQELTASSTEDSAGLGLSLSSTEEQPPTHGKLMLDFMSPDINAAATEPEQPTVQTMDRTLALETDDSEIVLSETSDEDGAFRIVHKSRLSDRRGDKYKNSPESKKKSSTSSPKRTAGAIRNKLSNAFRHRGKDKSVNSPDDEDQTTQAVTSSTTLHQDEFGFPLAIFTKGCLCHPYLCLQYYDLLQDVNVRSFVIGATNVLFKQKRHLTDVIVDVNDGKIEINDIELRKQLQLSTADLRFADILVKAVTGEDINFLEGTEWQGGDEWLRAEFKVYLLGLLSTSTTNDEHYTDDYNSVFVNAWRTTHNYRVWHNATYAAMDGIQPGHPCPGNLSVADIRLRLTSAMQTTERGKKINSAMTQTGKYVAQTGRAVGGAITQARSAVSSWFSSWKQSGAE